MHKDSPSAPSSVAGASRAARALLELLAGSARIFSLSVPENGIRITMDGHTLYTEVPGGRAPGILDGSIKLSSHQV